MTGGGFLEQRRASAGSLTIVIALHAAALTALMLSKTEFATSAINSLKVRNIPDTPPPPPEPPQPKMKPEVHQKTVIDQVQPRILVDRPSETVLDRQPDLTPVYDPGPIGNVIAEPVPLPEPKPEPVPEPVKKEAQLLASSELQPPYPASEQRAEVEGSVTVRIRIGTDGRVKSVERVRGSNDAFFRATEQQALRHWRFKPAMVDGRPAESTKTMTVHFQLAA